MGVLQRKLAPLPFFDVDEDPAIRVTEATNRSMRLHPAILDPGREHVKAPRLKGPVTRR
jgi:ATP-dependent 26S proteasome regulatory subunit